MGNKNSSATTASVAQDLGVEDSASHKDPPSWVLDECAMLNSAIYEEDVVGSLRQKPTRLTSISISEPQKYPGRVAIAFGNGEEKEKADDGYVFIVFRGTVSQEDVIVDLKCGPVFTTSGVMHNGFFDRADFDLDYIFKFFVQNKKVVITGHSLGGACATILTVKLMEKFQEYQMRDSLLCITFGCPLVGTQTVAGYMAHYPSIFHHYILDNDIVPKLCTIAVPPFIKALGLLFMQDLSQIENFRPFGNFYHLSLKDPKVVSCQRLLSRSKVLEFFDAKSITFSLSSLTDHKMANYYKGLTLSNAVPTHLPSECVERELTEFVSRPTVGSCLYCGDKLYIKGSDFVGVSHIYISSILIQVTELKDTQIVGKLNGFEKSALKGIESRDYCSLRLSSFFFDREFPQVPYTHIPDNAQDHHPNQIISSVLPLTTMLIRTEADSTVTEKLELISENVQQALGSIPIEFAFYVLTSDKEIDRPYLRMLLHRLASVQILNWESLCSTVMLDIMVKAINNLEKCDFSSADMKLYFNAFVGNERKHTLKFHHVSLMKFHTHECRVFVTSRARDTDKFWKFVVEEKIRYSMTLLYPGESVDSLDHVKLPAYISDEKVYSVKLIRGPEDFFGITHGERIGALRRFQVTTQNNCFQMIHITGFSEHLIDLIGVAIHILDCFGSIHVDNVGSYEMSLSLMYSLCLHFHQFGTDVETRNELYKYIPFLPAWEWVSEETKAFISRYKAISSHKKKGDSLSPWQNFSDFQIMSGHDSPQELVLYNLKESYSDMLRNYNSVYCPFLCGLSISMLVEHRETAAVGEQPRREPLFQFPTNPEFRSVESRNLTLNKADVVRAANSTGTGILFVNLMLDNALHATQDGLGGIRYESHNISWGTSIKRAGYAVYQTPNVVLWGAGKVLKAMVTDRSHIVEVEKAFYDLFHRIRFDSSQFKQYSDLIKHIARLLAIDNVELSSVRALEDRIYSLMPLSIKARPYSAICQDFDTEFSDPIFRNIKASTEKLNRNIYAFVLKLIVHCKAIADTRRSFLLVAINGQTNAGKTTLTRELVGKDESGVYRVRALPGTGAQQTTIYPIAYSDKTRTKTFVDLPGCTDVDTEKIATLFKASADVQIFVIKQDCPKNPNDEALVRFLQDLITHRKGPTLICINHFDIVLEHCESTDIGSAIETAHIERSEWVQSNLLHLSSFISFNGTPAEPSWQCEHRIPHALVVSKLDGGYESPPLSVWFCSFNCQIERIRDLSNGILANVADVNNWITEAEEWCLRSRYV